MRVGLLSGQVFSPFGEHWLAGSHGGGGISRWPGVDRRMLLVIIHEQAGVESAVRAVVIHMVTTVGRHWELQAAALLKAEYGAVCVLQAC